MALKPAVASDDFSSALGAYARPEKRINAMGACPSGRATHQGFVKKGGRPVTWIGGGGMDPRKLASLGVPQLRTLFLDTFGEHTASNNAAWLRRKLSEPPDATYGQGRCATVRARDVSAAIWAASGVRGAGGEDGSAEMPQEGGCTQDAALNSQCDEFATSIGITGCRAVKRSARGAELAQRHLPHVLGPCRSSSSSGGGGGDCSSGGAAATSSSGGMAASSASAATLLQPLPRSAQHPPGAGDSGSGSGSGGDAPPALRGFWPRMALTWDVLDAHFVGRSVEVYWPEDRSWWEATVLELDLPARRMLLLYANLSEEEISGQDLEELVAAGHLAQVGPPRPPAQRAAHHAPVGAAGSARSPAEADAGRALIGAKRQCTRQAPPASAAAPLGALCGGSRSLQPVVASGAGAGAVEAPLPPSRTASQASDAPPPTPSVFDTLPFPGSDVMRAGASAAAEAVASAAGEAVAATRLQAAPPARQLPPQVPHGYSAMHQLTIGACSLPPTPSAPARPSAGGDSCTRVHSPPHQAAPPPGPSCTSLTAPPAALAAARCLFSVGSGASSNDTPASPPPAAMAAPMCADAVDAADAAGSWCPEGLQHLLCDAPLPSTDVTADFFGLPALRPLPAAVAPPLPPPLLPAPAAAAPHPLGATAVSPLSASLYTLPPAASAPLTADSAGPIYGGEDDCDDEFCPVDLAGVNFDDFDVLLCKADTSAFGGYGTELCKQEPMASFASYAEMFGIEGL